MKYDVHFYKPDQLPEIEAEWHLLEQGVEMTYYQTYIWHQLLNRCYLPVDTSHYVSRYAVVRNNGQAVLIAPLWICLHRFRWVNYQGVFLIGRETWSDYVNFIYDNFDGDALLSCLCAVVEEFHVDYFCFDKMKNDTSAYSYLVEQRSAVVRNTEICAMLRLPDTIDNYDKMLSKNARQNLRTARNRLERNNIELQIDIDDKHVNREQCELIRSQRLERLKPQVCWLRRKKWQLMRSLEFHFPSFSVIREFDQSHFLTIKHGSVLCAFFNYIYDEDHHQILVMTAGVNSDYAWYSPGMLGMYYFICRHIEVHDVEIIDFTRGNEPYKYVLGCKNHLISSVSLRFSK